MPPKIQTELPDVPVNLSTIRPLLLLLPPVVSLNPTIANALAILRYSMATYHCNYSDAMAFISFLLEETKQTLAKDMSTDYLTGYAHLLRYKLDKQFDYVKALQQKRSGANLALAEAHAITNQIKATYVEMRDTFNTLEKTLKKHPECAAKLGISFKFRLYNTYIEALLYKTHLFQITNETALNALGTDTYIDAMEKLLPQLNNHSTTMDFLLLKIRHALQIKHDKKQIAINLNLAKEALDACDRDPDYSKDLYLNYNNHVTLAELSFYAYQLQHDPQKSTVPFLQEAANVALNAIKSIQKASEHHKAELSWIVTIILDSSLKNIRKNILFSDIDQLKTLLTFAESLNDLLPLLLSSTIPTTIELGQSISDSQKACINEIIELINNTIKTKQALAVAQEKDFDALNKKKTEYQKNFDAIAATFDTKAKRPASAKPKKSNQDKSPEKEKKPAEGRQTQEEKTTPELPTLAVYAENYFKHVDLWNIESLLETVDNDDHPEALIYIGDRYLKSHIINAALSAFEEAFDLAQKQTTPNEGIMHAIKIRLEDTNALIASKIRELNAEKAKLEESKQHLIIKFGLQALQNEGATKEQLNLRNQASRQNIYKRGLMVFCNIGKEKAARGEPLSEATQTRDAIDDYLDDLTIALNKSSGLIAEIQESRAPTNIIKLSGHQAALFNKKRESSTQQNNIKNKRKNR